jgi:hypothetical protein
MKPPSSAREAAAAPEASRNGKQYLHRATLTRIERLPHNRLRLRSGRVVRVGRAYRSD